MTIKSVVCHVNYVIWDLKAIVSTAREKIVLH